MKMRREAGDKVEFSSSFTESKTYTCIQILEGKTVELHLAYCGKEDCDVGHRFGPNKRVANVLHIVKRGNGILEYDDKIYHLSAGDVFYIEEGKTAFYQADWKTPWSYLWIGVTGFRAQESFANAGFSDKTPVRKIKNIELFEKYVDEILKSSQIDIESEFMRNGYLMLMLSALVAEYKANYPILKEVAKGKSAETYAKYLADYILMNYDQGIRINNIADEIGVNRSYLTNSFKKSMGCSPQEFLLNVRMEKAKYLLKQSNMQVKRIADKVGYMDQVGFSKKFKQYFGYSPKEYRERNQEIQIESTKQEYKGYGL